MITAQGQLVSMMVGSGFRLLTRTMHACAQLTMHANPFAWSVLVPRCAQVDLEVSGVCFPPLVSMHQGKPWALLQLPEKGTDGLCPEHAGRECSPSSSLSRKERVAPFLSFHCVLKMFCRAVRALGRTKEERGSVVAWRLWNTLSKYRWL